MQELKLALSREQRAINAAVNAAADALPEASQPVAHHVLDAGGKRLRPFLTLITGRALRANGVEDEGKLLALGAAIEILHAATLLHDDIMDNAATRRGKPSAHTLFPQASVILAGDAMLAKAVFMVSSFGEARMTSCIAEAVMRTAEGQIKEFSHLRDAALSEQDYLAAITGKTAWMLRASCELGALGAGADERTVEAAAAFGSELGIAFQMVDDALDFLPGTGKPLGGDVREGKATPPLLFWLATLSKDAAADFMKRFSQGDISEAEAAKICEEIVAGGHVERTREKATQYLEAARARLAVFPANDERVILEQMLSYILHRTH